MGEENDMATTSVRHGGGLPGQVTAARILVFIQAFFLLAAALILAVAARRTGHTAAAAGLAAINGIFGVTLMAAGVKMGACESWTPAVVIAFEVLLLILQVVNIVVGAPIGIIGVAIAIAVLVLMSTAPARSCFAGR